MRNFLLSVAVLAAAVFAASTPEVENAFNQIENTFDKAEAVAETHNPVVAKENMEVKTVEENKNVENVPASPQPVVDAELPELGSPHGAHSYEYLTGSRWAACGTITLVLNEKNAPAGALEDFKTAAAKLEKATGYDFKVNTTNANAPSGAYREVFLSYGRNTDRVLTSSSASASAKPRIQGMEITGGEITFNIDHDHYYTPGFGEKNSRTTLYMHELGHILGLDHTDDPNQLMYPTMGVTRDFGAGDKEGFRTLNPNGC